MARAASGMSLKMASAIGGLAGLTSTAIRAALGTRSWKSPSRLAATSLVKKLMPVALPPGRARLATRPSVTGSANAEDDRDRCGRSFGRLGSGGVAGRNDNGNAAADEVSHERRQAIVSPIQPMVLDRHVLALDVPGFVEAFTERSGNARGGIGRPNVDEADDRHRRLLRPRRKRPSGCRAAEKGDELASPHSITSSARSRNGSGIVRPSAFAVVRLMTSSNLVGCSTGMSAGLVPCRILSANSAARRNRAG